MVSAKETKEKEQQTFHIPCTSGTNACPPNKPSVPTSIDTRVTSFARVDNCSTMELTVIFKSSTSPCTSTWTVLLKSPRATALVTSEMERTWSVKLLAIFCKELLLIFWKW